MSGVDVDDIGRHVRAASLQRLDFLRVRRQHVGSRRVGGHRLVGSPLLVVDAVPREERPDLVGLVERQPSECTLTMAIEPPHP